MMVDGNMNKMEVHGDLAYVKAAREASLKRLDVDCIDLYYQHLIDIRVPIEVTMGEPKKLVEEGKIKYIGLSEASAATIRRAHAVHPITAVQMEWSLRSRDTEEEIVPTCRELGIGIVPYSPLGRGFFALGPKVVEMYERDNRKALKGEWREKVELATKFGINNVVEAKLEIRGDPAYVRAACEGSLKRLDVDCIDLYYQHRVDTNVPIEVTMGELKKLVEEGKIKYIGLSEASASTIRRAHAVHPITAVQLEWSLWTRDAEEEIVPVCRELGIGIVTYSPLGRGFLSTGPKMIENLPKEDSRLQFFPRFKPENLEHNKHILERVNAIAAKKGCTPAQLALSWVHHQGDDVCPIPGTTKIENLNQNIGALSVKLTPEEMTELESLASEGSVKGDRYVADIGIWKTADTPPLSSWKPE